MQPAGRALKIGAMDRKALMMLAAAAALSPAPASATIVPPPPDACTPYFCAGFGGFLISHYEAVYPEMTTRPRYEHGSEITATYKGVGTIVANVDWRPPGSCAPAPELVTVTELSPTRIRYEMVETYRTRFPPYYDRLECRILSGTVTAKDVATARELLGKFNIVWFNSVYYFESDRAITLQVEKKVGLRIAPETPAAR